jgi:hypothetical protein
MAKHLKGIVSPPGSAERSVDALVTGTVNAPYRRAIDSKILAEFLTSGDVQEWLVHVAIFFTDVKPGLVLSFASQHGIGAANLRNVYRAVKAKTGERNIELEVELGTVA